MIPIVAGLQQHQSDVSMAKIRLELECTQEEMATLLGVSKTTVARLEGKNAPAATGDVAKKLLQLSSLLADDKAKLLAMRKDPNGGLQGIAGLLQIGVASNLASGLTFGLLPILPGMAIIGGIIGGAVALKKALDTDDEDK